MGCEDILSFAQVHVAGHAGGVVPHGLVVSIQPQFVLEKLASSLTDGAGELERGADRGTSRRRRLEPHPGLLEAGADRL